MTTTLFVIAIICIILGLGFWFCFKHFDLLWLILLTIATAAGLSVVTSINCYK